MTDAVGAGIELRVYLPIPDLGTVQDTIILAPGGTILDLNVHVTATHSWVGDLIFNEVGSGNISERHSSQRLTCFSS